MTDPVPRILAKLDQARRSRRTCFGSDQHRFRLNQPLSERRLRAFEAEHWITLPADYRRFLAEAGNGGGGPYYGLLPLDRWNDAVLEDHPDYLARPSPLRPGMPAGMAWEQALGCTWEELFQGTLALVHQGCAYYALLVISGTYRGRVVYVDLDRTAPPYFVGHDDFLSWYERWLDELLWGYDVTWFGTGLPGREDDMVAALRSDAAAVVVQEALTTLGRIPTLRLSTLHAVQDALRHESPRVRAQAAQLLGKHAVPSAVTDLNALLRDRDPAARQAAVAALAKTPGVDWEPAARSALGDQDRDVVFRALGLLKEAGRLRRADVEGMLASADPAVRGHALWACDTVQEGQGAVAIPEACFTDLDREVRRGTILAAGSRKDRRAVPALLELLRRESDVELLSCAIGALGNIGDPCAVSALLPLTRHADAFVRQDTARALGRLGDRAAIPALEALLADTTKPVRRDAQGFPTCFASRSVADEAREALRRLRPAWYRWLFGVE